MSTARTTSSWPRATPVRARSSSPRQAASTATTGRCRRSKIGLAGRSPPTERATWRTRSRPKVSPPSFPDGSSAFGTSTSSARGNGMTRRTRPSSLSSSAPLCAAKGRSSMAMACNRATSPSSRTSPAPTCSRRKRTCPAAAPICTTSVQAARPRSSICGTGLRSGRAPDSPRSTPRCGPETSGTREPRSKRRNRRSATSPVSTWPAACPGVTPGTAPRLQPKQPQPEVELRDPDRGSRSGPRRFPKLQQSPVHAVEVREEPWKAMMTKGIRSPGASEAVAQVRLALETQQGLGESPRVSGRHELAPRLFGAHERPREDVASRLPCEEIPHAPDVRGHNRSSGGHRSAQRQGRPLVAAGQRDGVEIAVYRGKIRSNSREAHARGDSHLGGERLQPLLPAAAPDNDEVRVRQLLPDFAGNLEEHLVVFLGRDAADHADQESLLGDSEFPTKAAAEPRFLVFGEIESVGHDEDLFGGRKTHTLDELQSLLRRKNDDRVRQTMRDKALQRAEETRLHGREMTGNHVPVKSVHGADEILALLPTLTVDQARGRPHKESGLGVVRVNQIGLVLPQQPDDVSEASPVPKRIDVALERSQLSDPHALGGSERRQIILSWSQRSRRQQSLIPKGSEAPGQPDDMAGRTAGIKPRDHAEDPNRTLASILDHSALIEARAQDHVKAVYREFLVGKRLEMTVHLAARRRKPLPAIDLRDSRPEAGLPEQPQELRITQTVRVEPGSGDERRLPEALGEPQVVQCSGQMVAQIDPMASDPILSNHAPQLMQRLRHIPSPNMLQDRLGEEKVN